MKLAIFFLTFIICINLAAQRSADTLYRYGGGRFLLQQNGRFEFKQGDSLLSYWDKMDDVLTLDYKGYQVIQRKTGEKWVKGLFRRNEGKLFLQPEYEIVNNFFYFTDLVYVKGPAGCTIFSVITGKKTREGFSNFRQMATKYCLGFNEWGMFVYDKALQLVDSLPGIQFEGYQQEYGPKNFLYMKTKEGFVLLDDQFKIIPAPQWTKLSRLAGNLLVVETTTGQGVFHTGLRKMITPTDFELYSYEMHEDRFMLRKGGEYYLHDSLGNIITRVRAKGMFCVDDLKAFFYYQDDKFGIMSGNGKILQTPVFDDFNSSSQPTGFFIARKKGEKEHKRYAWVYTMIKGRKTITGIKQLGPWKEADPNPAPWPPNQPVEIKQ
jgi:hypothetical protein